MGLFDKLSFFKRKPKEEPVDYSSVGLSSPTYRPTATSTPLPAASEFATQENIKAKIDLVMTQIDNMRIQHESMNERMSRIESMLKQLLEMAKTTRF